MTSEMTIKRIQTWTWVLIFGGLFLLVAAFIGVSGGLGFNWYLGVLGIAATLAGAILVWVRSRMDTGSGPGN
jgi:hypothetical protein